LTSETPPASTDTTNQTLQEIKQLQADLEGVPKNLTRLISRLDLCASPGQGFGSTTPTTQQQAPTGAPGAMSASAASLSASDTTTGFASSTMVPSSYLPTSTSTTTETITASVRIPHDPSKVRDLQNQQGCFQTLFPRCEEHNMLILLMQIVAASSLVSSASTTCLFSPTAIAGSTLTTSVSVVSTGGLNVQNTTSTASNIMSVPLPSQWATIPVNYTAPYASGGLTAVSGGATATTVYAEQPTASYKFNASAVNNVAVYYGASPATQQGGIIALCENPNVDIVVLAFLTEYVAGGGYPAINFGDACWAATPAQQAAAPDLQDCSNVAWEVQGCQAMGKKVLLSLGGGSSNSTLASDAQGQQFANTL
jgi:hypothetical protein